MAPRKTAGAADAAPATDHKEAPVAEVEAEVPAVEEVFEAVEAEVPAVPYGAGVSPDFLRPLPTDD